MTEIEKLDAMLTELHVNHDLHRRFPEMDKDFSDKDWDWQVTVNDKNFGDNGVEGWLTAEQVVEMARKAGQQT